MIKKAVIPAAGYGTRSLPVTKSVPKEMFPVGNKPAIQLIVEEAVAAGIEEILIVLSRQKNMIVDYFDRSLELETFLDHANKRDLLPKVEPPNVTIQYIRQPYAKGLGDAVLLAKQFAGNEPFAILLPDDIILNQTQPGIAQLINNFEQKKGSVVGLLEVEQQYLHKYGVIDGEKIDEQVYRIKDMVEKPKHNPPSNKAVIGRYVFDPSIFSYLGKVKPGAGNEIQLTDAVKAMLHDYPCYGTLIDGKRYDIGSHAEYLQLNNELFDEK
ncbi:UTP--glucose-1-phosphate uridylyltransferase [Aquibacillus sediminis]|uniref:UTP--glucose-1-phosphate uridylyltransferase n=1 Tax=Aquibacillus sediminis TaxID=2574734 RepID=UPI001108465E|nr:UTP--glucose-1-phosphate uridylyltransferase [Aquibacillus sediminis]